MAGKAAHVARAPQVAVAGLVVVCRDSPGHVAHSSSLNRFARSSCAAPWVPPQSIRSAHSRQPRSSRVSTHAPTSLQREQRSGKRARISFDPPFRRPARIPATDPAGFLTAHALVREIKMSAPFPM
ncbi:hypothetical protein GFS60_07883 (plasmid) [Rhodococcus sp. WAY2]|nr:hypothetical protein GFS60_07883 [Rhodococcus sp. WAY2]